MGWGEYRVFRFQSVRYAGATLYRLFRSSRGRAPCVPIKVRSGSLWGALVHCDMSMKLPSLLFTSQALELWTGPGLSGVSALCWYTSPDTYCAPTLRVQNDGMPGKL